MPTCPVSSDGETEICALASGPQRPRAGHPPTPQAWHFRERIEENGYNTYASLHWHHNNLPMFLALDGRDVPQCGVAAGRGGITYPAISCWSWSPEALEGAQPRLGSPRRGHAHVQLVVSS
ncbi:Fibroblast Growth Factor 10 [Manis pentadactyla]|nr:Fibroblast Growth Factor 10 [Manis pentadactyla]